MDIHFNFITVILTYKMAKIEERSPSKVLVKCIDMHDNANAPQERTAVLLGRENILGSVVENLLDSLKMWKVVRISENHNRDTLIQDVKALKPGVVIIYKSESMIDIHFLIELLDECPGLKIITVSPESNSMQVYNKQRVWIRNSEDFLSMVEA